MPNRQGTKLGSRIWRTQSLVPLGILLLSQTAAAAGSTFVVNSFADVPAGPNTTDGICETATGNGVCTLRAAIMEANATVDATVRVPAGFYLLGRAPTAGVHPENGDLDVLTPMKIEGDGPSVSVVDGNDLHRVFRVAPALTTPRVEIRGLTVQNGQTGPINVDGEGGGILATEGSLLLENLHLRSNTATLGGAGVAAGGNSDSLTIRHSIIEDNETSPFNGLGGGIDHYGSGSVVVEDSLISGNRAASGAGVVMASGSLRLERTAIVASNAFYNGGGVRVDGGSLDILNSVVHGNQSRTGSAGVDVYSGTATLNHATVTENVLVETGSSFSDGAGIRVRPGHNATLDDSIVFGNLDRYPTESISDCEGDLFSLDYNLVSPLTCPLLGQTAHNVTASGLNSLGFNGGFSRDVASDFTPAEAAVPASACLDLLGAPLLVDYRGHRRKPVACDIGAHDAGAIYTPTQLLGVNLVRNGGATGQELGLAATVASPANVELYQAPYWAQTPRMVQLLYGAPDGYPTLGDAPPGSGHKFFAGGIEAFTFASQSFDVSAIAAQIDAGDLPYEVAGAFGGVTTDNDRATLFVVFYDAGGAIDGELLDEFQLGGFSAADRGDQTRLIRAERSGVVPAGTRFITLDLFFERFDGAANDGYADAISLVLPEPGSGASLGAVWMALAALARRRGHRIPNASDLSTSDAPARDSVC